MFRRRSTPTTEPHAELPRDTGCIAIANASPRVRIRVAGDIVRVRTVPTSGQPTLEIRVDDGSGYVTAVWFGRRSIGGLTLGRRVTIEGVARVERGRLVFANPAYDLGS